ncbi:MAG: tetratricopeptide repeat protein [Planctomycetes bacterium]|nr:tetratricopeptide repeat protein [Planctomycetota bacterium]
MIRGLLRVLPLFLWSVLPAAAQDPDDYGQMLRDAQSKLVKGQLSSAENVFQELLDAHEEEPESAKPPMSLVLSARAGLLDIALRHGKYQMVIDATQALSAADTTVELKLLQARALRAVGRYDEAIALLSARIAVATDDVVTRFFLGETQWANGERAAAKKTFSDALLLPASLDPTQLAFRGRCRWRLGGREQFTAAAEELVAAMDKGKDLPYARTTYGILQFEAYGEAAGFPSGERELKKVLDTNGDLEEALLAMYRIRSANGNLDGAKTDRYLERVLQQNPRCVSALVLRGAMVLDDRRYRDAAQAFDEILRIDPRDRAALSHRAAAALLLHDEVGYQQFRSQALKGDPGYPEVDRIIGDHLVALYRFADAIPFFNAALLLDPSHVGALQGSAKALIYTGEGKLAKEMLQRAKAVEPGFNQPWRENALAVQSLLEDEYVLTEGKEFALQLHRDDSEVLREYLMPTYLRALEELGGKYAFRPTQQVKVEMFHTWDDFSVRTVGFRGFTALGACFGNFITLVSPGDSDVRRQDFMWEATVWHEYAHVLTLGLSKQRVPRWLTEGFSVYEEKSRNPSWERGMDRELFDAFYNREIPPVRLLNRLFRGERILFGYYQGGLIVELLARDFGFPKAIELLRAFGDDLDTEEAFERALDMPSQEFDRRFLTFVERDKLAALKLVPHYDEAALQRLIVKVAAEPDQVAARIALAWAHAQRNNPVDAGPQLARVLQKDPQNGDALLLRAELLRARGAFDEAIDCWRRGFAAGADDFDSRIQCGRTLAKTSDVDSAIEMFQQAKKLWTGCTEQENAPELLLAAIYRERGERELVMHELRTYCQRSGRAYAPRWTLAEFAREQGDRQEEARLLSECNQIDPFRSELHRLLASAQESLGDHRSAALEYEVAASVPISLDREYLGPGKKKPAEDDPELRAARGLLWLSAGRLRLQLGDALRGRSLLRRVLQEAAGSAAATDAQTLLDESGGERGKD